MNWKLLFLACMLSALISCGNKSNKEETKTEKPKSESEQIPDIDTSKMQDACDFADAMLASSKQLVAELKRLEKLNPSTMTEKLWNRADAFEEQIYDIETAAEDRGIDTKELENCPSYKQCENNLAAADALYEKIEDAIPEDKPGTSIFPISFTSLAGADKIKNAATPATACDFASALLSVTEEMMVIVKENINKDEADVSAEVQMKAAELGLRAQLLAKKMEEKNIDREDLQKCPAYPKLEALEKEIEILVRDKAMEMGVEF